MLIQIGGWEILPTLVRPTSPSGLNECWTGLGSSRLFGIVLFWFVKLLIIYRLLQQTSKIYSLSWTAQNCSTLKMVKYPPRRSWTKLFKPVLAYKPSNGASFWWLLLRYFLVLSILIVTATVARVGASRALVIWRRQDCSCIGQNIIRISATALQLVTFLTGVLSPQNVPCRLFSAKNDASRHSDKWSLS